MENLLEKLTKECILLSNLIDRIEENKNTYVLKGPITLDEMNALTRACKLLHQEMNRVAKKSVTE